MRASRCGLTFLLFACAITGCYRPTYSGPYACDPKHGAVDCPEGFRCVDRLCVAPNAAPDLGSNSGCASGGTLLALAHGERAWACSGSFSAGGFASLCSDAPGTHVCGQDPRDDELLKLLDCDQVDGFYLAQLAITVMPNAGSYDAKCDMPPGAAPRALLGCGIGSSAIHLNAPDCHALHHAILCPASGAWSCSEQAGLMDAAHDGSTDEAGTLCCTGAPR